jgi:hypothetical protein
MSAPAISTAAVDQPCHADVLLKRANCSGSGGRTVNFPEDPQQDCNIGAGCQQNRESILPHPEVVVPSERYTQDGVQKRLGTTPVSSEGTQGEQPVGSEHRGEDLNLEELPELGHGPKLSCDASIERYAADPKRESFRLSEICILVKKLFRFCPEPLPASLAAFLALLTLTTSRQLAERP